MGLLEPSVLAHKKREAFLLKGTTTFTSTFGRASIFRRAGDWPKWCSSKWTRKQWWHFANPSNANPIVGGAKNDVDGIGTGTDHFVDPVLAIQLGQARGFGKCRKLAQLCALCVGRSTKVCQEVIYTRIQMPKMPQSRLACPWWPRFVCWPPLPQHSLIVSHTRCLDLCQKKMQPNLALCVPTSLHLP